MTSACRSVTLQGHRHLGSQLRVGLSVSLAFLRCSFAQLFAAVLSAIARQLPRSTWQCKARTRMHTRTCVRAHARLCFGCQSVLAATGSLSAAPAKSASLHSMQGRPCWPGVVCSLEHLACMQERSLGSTDSATLTAARRLVREDSAGQHLHAMHLVTKKLLAISPSFTSPLSLHAFSTGQTAMRPACQAAQFQKAG